MSLRLPSETDARPCAPATARRGASRGLSPDPPRLRRLNPVDARRRKSFLPPQPQRKPPFRQWNALDYLKIPRSAAGYIGLILQTRRIILRCDIPLLPTENRGPPPVPRSLLLPRFPHDARCAQTSQFLAKPVVRIDTSSAPCRVGVGRRWLRHRDRRVRYHGASA